MLLYSVIVLVIVVVLMVWQAFSPEARLRKKRQKVHRKPVTRAKRPAVQLFTKIKK